MSLNSKPILEKMLNTIDLIYPPICGICGKLDKNFLCRKCYKILENESKFIVERKSKENFFQEHLYIFKYEGIIRKVILKYKFQDKAYIYKTFVNFLLKNEKFFKIIKSYDTIIPVPISKQRKKERGYNQSYLLAREIAKNVGLNLINNVLYKTIDTIEQSKLKREDRIKNLQGVYKAENITVLNNKNILLIDDVYTTGSTVTQCCKTLNQANLNKIGVFTIAKD